MRRLGATVGALAAATAMSAVCGNPASGSAPDAAHRTSGHIVIGHGNPKGCTSTAVVKAVAGELEVGGLTSWPDEPAELPKLLERSSGDHTVRVWEAGAGPDQVGSLAAPTKKVQ